jgi:hypothetical protein
MPATRGVLTLQASGRAVRAYPENIADRMHTLPAKEHTMLVRELRRLLASWPTLITELQHE